MARALGNQKEVPARLIDLLNEMSALEDVKDEHGSAIHPPGSTAGVYCTDLPELTMTFRESGVGKSIYLQFFLFFLPTGLDA